MNVTNRYSAYFNALKVSQGDLPEGDFQALVRTQLEAIEAQLVAGQYDEATIAHEMYLAREASGPWLVAPALLSEASPAPQAVMADKTAARTSTTLGAFISRHLLAVLIGLFAICYVAVLAFFFDEGHPALTVSGVSDKALPVEIHFVSVDLMHDSATLFVTPDLRSPLIAESGRLTGDVAIEIDTGDVILSHVFKAGTAPIPWHAVIPFEYGDQLDYPFDRHGGDFLLRVSRPGADGQAPQLDIDKIAHGFKLEARAAPTPEGRQLDVSYEVRRSASVIFVAVLALLSLTLVCLSAVRVAWAVARQGRNVEFSMMIWIAALLFVIPTVRNGLPGGPPHGALVDIALIYWLHFLTVGSLLTVVRYWSKQR